MAGLDDTLAGGNATDTHALSIADLHLDCSLKAGAT
jgi:hypothetical protein